MKKERIDVLLVQNGLVESRNLAQRLIMAGQVRVNGQTALKSSTKIAPNASLEVIQGPPFVSRGGEKLAAALKAFRPEITGWTCADVGSSTGGFTDCLLQNGAEHVYAIDVGKGILHWKIRQDKRVTVMEGVNARHLESLPRSVDLVTIDASFISLRILLPVVHNWFGETGGEVIALIKPQFEVGRKEAARGDGVIRDPKSHQRVLADTLAFAEQSGYRLSGLVRSPVTGPKGNIEFLVHLLKGEVRV